MRPSSSGRLGALGLLLALAGCADTPPPPPSVTAVVPSAIAEQVETTLAVTGANLFVRVRTDFTESTAEPMNTYAVRLRSAVREVDLEIVSHLDETQLEVRVPAGVPAGRYALELTDPWGRTATVEEAVRLLGPCETLDGPAVGDTCEGADTDLCLDEVYACVSGVLTCVQGTDEVELCDGVDNDCDPSTADGAAEPTLGDACEGGDSDLCEDDVVACTGGVLGCAMGAGNAELCDGEDNDCNPATADGADEALLETACDGPDLDLCEDDQQLCTGGTLTCSTGGDNAELCDGEDNDCDPSTADGEGDPGAGVSCDGSDSDSCTDDLQECVDGALACSTGAANPELCDGVDNDCDGDPLDDGADDPGVGALCQGADGDLCVDDVQQCQGGGLTCVAGSDNPELCDGEDNDCDPSTGDGAEDPGINQACDGSDLDSCVEGTTTCSVPGTITCSEPAEDFCGVVFKVGTLTKSTSGAPVSQVITHGLGATPKAILFWTIGGEITTAATPNHMLAIGMVDQARVGRSHASSSQDGGGLSLGARRHADAAITIVRYDQALIAQATVSAWNASTFTLSWTTNDNVARRIHYLAIAGPQVSSKTRTWQMPNTGTTGVTGVTGVGFSPDALVSLVSGLDLSSSSSTTVDHDFLFLSAADASLSEWAVGIASEGNQGVSQTVRAQRSDRFIYMFNAAGSITRTAELDAMTSDGFNLNWLAGGGSAGWVSTLAFEGLQAKTLCFNRRLSVGTQSITGLGFQPQAILFSSFQQGSAGAPVAHAYMGVGGSDGAVSRAVAVANPDNEDVMEVVRIDRTSAYVEVGMGGTIIAEASLQSFDSNGFTLNWTTHDTSAAELCALALGPPPP